MTISDQGRHDLHQRLAEVLGPDEAATLMEHLPPVGWADVATKRDLDHLALELRSEMAAGFSGLRLEFQREVGGLRVDTLQAIGGLRAETLREVGGLRTETLQAIDGLRAETLQAIDGPRADLGRQLLTLFLGLLGLQVSAAGLIAAVSRLL